MSGEIQPMVDGGQQLFLPTMAISPELDELAALHREQQSSEAEWFGHTAVINGIQKTIAEEYADQVLEPRRHIWSRVTEHLANAPFYHLFGSSHKGHHLEWRFRQYAQQDAIDFAVDTRVTAKRMDGIDETAVALDALVKILHNGKIQSVSPKDFDLSEERFGRPEIRHGLRRHWSEAQLRRGMGAAIVTGLQEAMFAVEATPLGTGKSSRILFTNFIADQLELKYYDPHLTGVGGVLNPDRAVESLNLALHKLYEIPYDPYNNDDLSHFGSFDINETLRLQLASVASDVYDGKSWRVGSQFEELLKVDDVLAKSQPIYRH